MRLHHGNAAGALLVFCSTTAAISLDVNDADSIKSAAKTIASNIIARYNSSSPVPGLLEPPYNWWEGGLAWDSMVNYWFLTNDTTYNDVVGEALLFQVGPNNDYMPPNQTRSEGNDDQSFWALAAMTAAEDGFPYPGGVSSNGTWLQLAENEFNDQVARWDNSTCGGGLRWQIFSFNDGYNYKQSLGTGNFYQLAARLARFTGNSTYVNWAETAYNWTNSVGLIAQTDGALAVYDGTDDTTKCSQVNNIQWTVNQGTFLYGSAVLYNTSSSQSDLNRTSTFVDSLKKTFASTPGAARNGVLTEVACAPLNNCDVEQLAFRAPTARALGQTLKIAAGQDTSIASSLNTIIQASAQGAAAQCSGGSNGTICGSNWAKSTWDGTSGYGQDLSALEIILANLATSSRAIQSINTTANGTTSSTTTSSNATTTGTSAAPASAQTTSGAGTSSVSGAFALMAVVIVLGLTTVL